MKLSNNTLSILQSFVSINESIFVRKGNTLRTVSHEGSILAVAKIDEVFPRDFAIYELKQFLSGLSLHQDFDLDFKKEKYVSIIEGNRHVKYFFADPDFIKYPPDKDFILPSKDICFKLDSKSLQRLLKASDVYYLLDLSLIGANGELKFVLRDKSNEQSNEYSIILGSTDKNFEYNIGIDNLKKILLGPYDVVLSKEYIIEFSNTQHNLKYVIGLEEEE